MGSEIGILGVAFLEGFGQLCYLFLANLMQVGDLNLMFLLLLAVQQLNLGEPVILLGGKTNRDIVLIGHSNYNTVGKYLPIRLI